PKPLACNSEYEKIFRTKLSSFMMLILFFL
ncbi:MAG: hypothetical protein ACJAS9_002151, partial [Polaribacter sp.]